MHGSFEAREASEDAVFRTRIRCVDCTVRQHAVCANCERSELDMLSDIKVYRSYTAGEHIMSGGERAPFLGTVVSGVASVSRLMSDGRRQVVGLLFPGDMVGRPFSPVSPFDCSAVTDLRVCAFTRPYFENAVRTMPSLERRLLEMTLEDLDSAREWMVLLGRKSAQERLCSFFVLAARRLTRLQGGSPGDGATLELPMSREDMADFLGLTIETVSRQVGALKKAGVIELIDARHLMIPDWQALLDAAGGELESA